jgi:poly-gamma-glutamate synthesis protein (capsule biosynthesis protein)
MTRLSFLGDTLIGGEAQPVLDQRGPRWALDGIRHLFESSDLVVANHEGPLTLLDRPATKLDTGRKRYWYRGDPESAQALVGSGIRVVSLANNHILDFGERGLLDTIEALDAAGIAHCGAGTNRTEARRAAVVEVNGLKIGFLSFMQRYDVYIAERLYASRTRAGPLQLRPERARRDIANLSNQTDLTVALVHWGRNYKRENPRQQRLAAELRTAGAGIVIGHHPHIPQRVTVSDGVPICFSLGNGPLGTPGRFHSGRPPYGLVVSIDLDRCAVPRSLSVVPIHVDNSEVQFQPRVATDSDARRLLRRILPRDLDWTPCFDHGLTASLDGHVSTTTDPERVGREDQNRSTAGA